MPSGLPPVVGGVLTTSNPLNTPTEITKQVAYFKLCLAFTTPSLFSKLSIGVAAGLPIVILDMEDKVPNNPRVVSCITKMMRSDPTEGAVTGRRVEKVSQDDTATLLYLSGTTEMSKGVVLTYLNLISMVQIILN